MIFTLLYQAGSIQKLSTIVCSGMSYVQIEVHRLSLSYMNYIIYTNYQLCFRTAWLVSGSKSNSYYDRRPRGKPFVKIIDGLYLSDRKSHFISGASTAFEFIINFGSIRYCQKPRHVVMGTGTCICEKEISPV